MRFSLLASKGKRPCEPEYARKQLANRGGDLHNTPLQKVDGEKQHQADDRAEQTNDGHAQEDHADGLRAGAAHVAFGVGHQGYAGENEGGATEDAESSLEPVGDEIRGCSMWR